MLALFQKEINSFFSSVSGYLAIAVFLLASGLFLWVFQGQFNVFDFGFADLSPFFSFAPWVFMFLVPAVCMRSFSEEKRQGTLELLFTKPVTTWQLVLGKYFGAFAIVVLALAPTLLYVLTIHFLGETVGNFDLGATFGSYLGLLFLGACYCAIGVFASSLSQNQLVAFIIAVFLCFLTFFGFSGVSDIGIFGSETYALEYLGIEFHYESISRGVIGTRDLVYFLSIPTLFLFFTKINLDISLKKKWTRAIFVFIVLMIVNFAASRFYQRFDLTEQNRYTLSTAAKEIVGDIESPILVRVFLAGDFPSGFERLQLETRRILEEFSAYNPQVKYEFVNPLSKGGDALDIAEQFYKSGMVPENMSTVENGKTSTRLIFPWAVANYRNQSAKIHLLQKNLTQNTSEMVNNSIQNLEYAFADAFKKLTSERSKKIAVMRGNGELPDGNIASFIRSLRDYYLIAPFTLDSAKVSPQETLNKLDEYDLLIEAKPTEAFTEKEKYVLDQYLMRGGKILWLVEAVSIDKDSLFNETNQALAYPVDLNLGDYFFKYGIRINPVVVKDLRSAPIILARGTGQNTQFAAYPWSYSPLAVPKSNHPIVNDIKAVKFDFANTIDTLKNEVEKTILLKTSPETKTLATPVLIGLDEIRKKPNLKTYLEGEKALAVLLEGKFTSVYKNRVKPFDLNNTLDESKPTKMAVIADGNVIKNELKGNQPVPLGFARYSGETYGNQEFLMNMVNYLLDDTGLINIRSKELSLAFLDSEKIAEEKLFWQLINLGLPLVLLGLFGLGYNYFRKRKYIKQ
jgi:ABC-2 type transport system permease protein